MHIQKLNVKNFCSNNQRSSGNQRSQSIANRIYQALTACCSRPTPNAPTESDKDITEREIEPNAINRKTKTTTFFVDSSALDTLGEQVRSQRIKQ
jgi:hypothetical protein